MSATNVVRLDSHDDQGRLRACDFATADGALTMRVAGTDPLNGPDADRVDHLLSQAKANGIDRMRARRRGPLTLVTVRGADFSPVVRLSRRRLAMGGRTWGVALHWRAGAPADA